MSKIKLLTAAVATFVVLVIVGLYIALINIQSISVPLFAKACDTCSGQVGSIDLAAGKFSAITLTDVQMAFGKVGISRWTVAIKKMELKFDFKSALNSRISIHPLRIVGAQVQLSESDKAKEQKSTFQFPSKLRSLHVEDISVRQGEFTYIDINAAKRKGILTFKDIDVDINQIQLTHDKTPLFTTNVEAKGTFGPGHIKLGIDLKIPYDPLFMVVNTQTEGFDLNQLNSYTEPVEDLRLQGQVGRSNAHLVLKDNRIAAKLSVLYDNLTVKALHSEEQSQFVAFLTTLGMNAQLCNTNTDRGRDQYVQAVDIKRKDESIVQFLLRAHLEAGLSIACYEQKKS